LPDKISYLFGILISEKEKPKDIVLWYSLIDRDIILESVYTYVWQH
jgi:hypothetical protein